MKSNTNTGNLPPAIINGSIKNKTLATFTDCVREYSRWDLFDLINEDLSWTAEEIEADSPRPIPKNRNKQAQALVKRYQPSDHIWFGRSLTDPLTPNHFWFPAEKLCTSELIAGGYIQAHAISSATGNMVRRFLIIKTCGHPERTDEGGLFRWLKLGLDMDLVAVVDAGQGVYEGWFHPPDDQQIEILRDWLIFADVCCPDSFDLFQKAVLPGKSARLLYLAK